MRRRQKAFAPSDVSSCSFAHNSLDCSTRFQQKSLFSYWPRSALQSMAAAKNCGNDVLGPPSELTDLFNGPAFLLELLNARDNSMRDRAHGALLSWLEFHCLAFPAI